MLKRLSEDYRVVAFDLRWHGRGIRSPKFRFEDCADDVPAVLDVLGIDRAGVVGYSMGGAIAQLTWVRHRSRVAGLVLCSTARNYRGGVGERLFVPVMTAAMDPMSTYALERVERIARDLPLLPSADAADLNTWGIAELRSTSAWAMPAALGELGRFDSKSWISGVDVPTAVVVTEKDRAIPARRQHRLGEAIPGARVLTVEGGHTSLFMRADRWQPVFLDAVAHVVG
jgi:pimeloyl-ACP methyl ester carboxylesterase